MELIQLHLLISNTMIYEDWNEVDNLISAKIERNKDTYNKKQKMKNQNYHRAANTQFLDIARIAVNLTEQTFTEMETSVLCKERNFTLTPHVPT